jgi:hypothetical protein
LSVVSDDLQDVSELLKSYFSEKQIQQVLQTATKDAVLNYITTINDTLSGVQRENLFSTLEKYKSPQQTPPNP